MKYKIGDIVRAYTIVGHLNDLKVSWRGTIKFIGPTFPPYSQDNPMLSLTDCWVLWDNGNVSRKSMIDPDPSNLEMDKEYLRDEKLKDLFKSENIE